MLGTTKTLVVLMDQIIKKKEVIKMKRIQEKHEKWQGYIDETLIDYEKSYRIESKPNIYGRRLVYQNITMNDGTVYELLSQSTSTRGIFSTNIKDKGLAVKEVKTYVGNPILY